MLKNDICILFTSVGRRVELIQRFREAAQRLGIALTLVGADTSDSAPALFFCDRKKKVCRIKEPAYIPQLLSICAEEKIDALIPTIDTDLLILAQEKERFAAQGTRVVISGEDEIRLCRDKRLTSGFFQSVGLLAPTPIDDYRKYNAGYPAFIKPLDGSSSIGANRVNSPDELKERAAALPDYIVQPFIAGREYTVDIFCDFHGNPVYITPRERLAVRSGEVLKTRIDQDPKIKEECWKLVSAFHPCGQITVQLIRQDQTGDDYYIEINPRFGGGAPLGMMAGADSAEAMLRLLHGDELAYTDDAAAQGTIFSRFDQCVCVDHGDALPPEAVIFDLDDTLYPERQYVRGGFAAVAAVLSETENAAEKLWAAFEAHKNAIDTVLEDEKLPAGEWKERCISAYRRHDPVLSLFPGIPEVFAGLKARGVKIGILTDGRPEGQRAKLHALGLESVADEILITDELGGVSFRKPDDLCFRVLLRRLGVPAGRAVYVGDNAGKDKTAAERAGVRFLHIAFGEGLYASAAKPTLTAPEQILRACGFDRK